MSLELRVEKLESEMLQVRKILHHKNENQHQVWNDMQEQIYDLCVHTAKRLDALERQQTITNQRLDRMEDGFEKMTGMIQQLLDRNQ